MAQVRLCQDGKPCHSYMLLDGPFLACRHGVIFSLCPLDPQYARERKKQFELIKFMKNRKTDSTNRRTMDDR